MNIVYITDEQYVMALCVSITSLVTNNKPNINIFVLCNNISSSSKKLIKDCEQNGIKIELIEVSTKKYDEILETNGYVSKTAMIKFEIPLVMHDIDKILYLDCDLIIQNDISELFNIDMGDKLVAAVDDMGDQYNRDGKSNQASRIPQIKVNEYFNSGVLLLNLDQMRKKNIPQKLIEYRKTGYNLFVDQDAFNVVLGEDRMKLPVKYNFLVNIYDQIKFCEINKRFFEDKYTCIEECIQNQTIVHFAGEFKPWEYSLYPATNYFLSYYNLSPYKDKILKLKSPIKELSEIIEEYEKKYLDTIEDMEKFKHQVGTERVNLEWAFPYDKISRNSKVIVYGAGDVGRSFIRQNKYSEYVNIVLWCDANWREKDNVVKNPSLIKEIEYEYILIAVVKEDIKIQILNKLKMMGIDLNKVVTL